MSRRAAFLDRDGTLIVERHYLSDPDGVALLPGAAAGLRGLRALGFGLVVVTNQSGLGRGLFDQGRLDQVHARLTSLLAQHAIELDGIYVCPHHPNAGCGCRKPQPGLVLQAASDLGLDVERSIVVGDKACDVGLGRAVGARAFLVRTGYGAEVEQQSRSVAKPSGSAANAVVDDLRALAELLRAEG